MNLNSYIKTNRPLIIEHLTSFFENKKTERHDLPFLEDTIARLTVFMPNGKLIRGILVMLAYEMVSHKPASDVISIAAAMEFTQSTLLIHDDIMDQDTTRRGAATIYAQYMNRAADDHLKNPLLYGQSMAICVGDIGFYFAFELLAQAGSTHPELLREYSREIQYVGAAQMADVNLSYIKAEPSPEEIITVYRYKTGRYSFSLPMKLGAIAAGATDDILQKLDALGEELGIMFQMHDDYLGMTSTKQEIGKPVGSDIRENKKTLMRQMLFERANESDRKILQNIFGNPKFAEKDHQTVLSLIQTYHVARDMESLMQERASKAESIAHTVSVAPEYHTILEDIIRFNTTRRT